MKIQRSEQLNNYPTSVKPPTVFVPKKRVTLPAIVSLPIVAIVGGVVVGGIVAFISQWFYFIVVFSALMGGLGGTILSLIILQTHMRNVLLAIVFGLLIGLVTYGSLRYGQYLLFREQVKSNLVTQVGSSSQSQVDQFIQSSLQSEVGSGGFFGYIKLQAKEGVTITRGLSTTGVTFKETWAWIYWSAELLIVGGLAALMGYRTARRNYCESCQRWYSGSRSIGKVDQAAKDYFRSAVQSGHFFQAGQVLRNQATSKQYLDVQVESCSSCKTSLSYMVVHQLSGGKGKENLKLLTSRRGIVGNLLSGKKEQGKEILKQQLIPEQYEQLQNGLLSQAISGYNTN